MTTPNQFLSSVDGKRQAYCFELGDVKSAGSFMLSAENAQDYQLWVSKLIQKGSVILKDDDGALKEKNGDICVVFMSF